MTSNGVTFRRFKSNAAITVMGLLVFVCFVPLVSLLYSLISNGFPALDWDFFTKTEGAFGEPSGVIHAIIGSVQHMVVACLIAAPLGLLVAMFLARPTHPRLASLTRLLLDVLAGIPAIIIGVFVYSTVVVPYTRLTLRSGFTLLSGGFALALIMLPIFVRGTEQALRAIPRTVDEAGLALGLPAYRVLTRIVLPAAVPAVLTGLFLALARISGEAAPLLMTSFGNRTWSMSPLSNTASLPVLLFNYAKSGFESQNQQAWGAALVLVLMILSIRLMTFLYNRWRYGPSGGR